MEVLHGNYMFSSKKKINDFFFSFFFGYMLYAIFRSNYLLFWLCNRCIEMNYYGMIHQISKTKNTVEHQFHHRIQDLMVTPHIQNDVAAQPHAH